MPVEIVTRDGTRYTRPQGSTQWVKTPTIVIDSLTDEAQRIITEYWRSQIRGYRWPPPRGRR